MHRGSGGPSGSGWGVTRGCWLGIAADGGSDAGRSSVSPPRFTAGINQLPRGLRSRMGLGPRS